MRGRHFAHIAENLITQQLVDTFAAELAEDESLTVYATKTTRQLDLPDNITLKRIPRDLIPPPVPKSNGAANASTDEEQAA